MMLVNSSCQGVLFGPQYYFVRRPIELGPLLKPSLLLAIPEVQEQTDK